MSSLVWHHPAAPCDRLTVKQVYRKLRPGLLPRDIGGTATVGRVVAALTGDLTP
jgi:hypothetical protein